MKIERIDKLQGSGVFRDFRWSDVPDLQKFGRFNLVYGWNGSGKTTLSRILRSLELRSRPQGGDIALRVTGRRIEGSEFGEVQPETIALKVFNQDFIKDNVFRPDHHGMTPLWCWAKGTLRHSRRLTSSKQSSRH